MNGLVPAFAIEFFPVNFLEFRDMLETVNLKGTQNSNGSDLLAVLLRGGGQFAGGAVGGINTTNSSFTYKGTINTFELGFKPRGDAAKFLFLKLGMSQEIYQKQYDKYFAFDSFGALGGPIIQSGFNPIAQFINSTIYTSYVNSEIVIRNLYGQVEFRKGFN